MNDRKPYILLLGASQDQRFIIKTAQSMGLGTLVLDMNPDSAGFGEADISAVVSTRDVQAVIGCAEKMLAKGFDLRGVSVMGSDIPHIVHQVADHFGWQGPASQTARWTTHKYEMKKRLHHCGIPVPRFAKVHNTKDILRAWNTWQCPQVVIKPVDQAGSRGVWCISSHSLATAAYENAITSSVSKEIIVEEFVEGPQISTESILADGQADTPGLVDRCYQTTLCYLPQIIENGGWYPSVLNRREQCAIRSLVESAARALGIVNGVAKGDVVVCKERGPMLIEMASRLSGGDFSESLIPLGTGVNYVEAALQIAMGFPVAWHSLLPQWEKAVINRYFFLPKGHLQAIEGSESAASLSAVAKFQLFVKPGDKLPDITSHGKRSGVFIVVADNRQAAEAVETEVYQRVRFKIDGQWVNGHPSTRENSHAQR